MVDTGAMAVDMDMVPMYLVPMQLSIGLARMAKASMETLRRGAMAKAMAKQMANMARGRVGNLPSITEASRMHSLMPLAPTISPMVGQMLVHRDQAMLGSEGS